MILPLNIPKAAIVSIIKPIIFSIDENRISIERIIFCKLQHE